jgi:hypothetical protein
MRSCRVPPASGCSDTRVCLSDVSVVNRNEGRRRDRNVAQFPWRVRRDAWARELGDRADARRKQPNGFPMTMLSGEGVGRICSSAKPARSKTQFAALLGPRGPRRVFRRRAARYELLSPILEVLRFVKTAA